MTDRSTTLAMKTSATAGRIGLEGIRTPATYLYPWTTAGTLRVNCHLSLQVFLPRPNHLGNHTQTRVRRRVPGFLKGFSSASPQSRKRAHQWSFESLDAPAPLAPCVRDSTHPVQFGIFPKRLFLPQPDDEILSGYDEDVSSVRDGYSAWVKMDPASTLERHLAV